MNTSAVRIEPDHPTEQVSDKVEEKVEQHPWLEHLARFGWIAKGVVYVLMGLTAFTIGRRRPTSDDASPEGAVGQLRCDPVRHRPDLAVGGRARALRFENYHGTVSKTSALVLERPMVTDFRCRVCSIANSTCIAFRGRFSFSLAQGRP